MKLAFLLPFNFIGGGVFFVFEHAKRLSAKGHDVTIVFENDYSPLEITSYPEMLAVECIHLSAVPEGNLFDCAVATSWQTVYSLDRIEAKHYCYLVQDNERNFFSEPDRCCVPLVDQTYRENLHFITSTAWLEKMLRSEFGKEATTVPYSIDFAKYGVEKAAFPRTSKKRVLVEGPPGDSRKRIPFTFQVLSQFPDLEVFYAAGSGQPDPAWRIDQFFSAVPYHQMPTIYASCDFVLKLSSQESFALPVLESFASGGTAITSAFTGHDFYIKHRENALVVPIDDETAAVAAVQKLVGDNALMEALKLEAKKTSHLFSWDISSQKMEQKLSEISSLPVEGKHQLNGVASYKNALADYYELRERFSDSYNIRNSRTFHLSERLVRYASALRRLKPQKR